MNASVVVTNVITINIKYIPVLFPKPATLSKTSKPSALFIAAPLIIQSSAKIKVKANNKSALKNSTLSYINNDFLGLLLPSIISPP